MGAASKGTQPTLTTRHRGQLHKPLGGSSKGRRPTEAQSDQADSSSCAIHKGLHVWGPYFPQEGSGQCPPKNCNYRRLPSKGVQEGKGTLSGRALAPSSPK